MDTSQHSIAWPDSLWKATAQPYPPLRRLDAEVSIDVLVIGAGYTGLSAALHLRDATSDIVVIDKAQPGWGCSGRNGGQINPNWKPALARLRQLYPGASFDRFIETVDRSADLVFNLIEQHQIKCNALRNGCIVATRGSQGRQYLADWSRYWQSRGTRVELLASRATADAIGCDAYDLSMLDHRGGSLQPLSYAHGLARACTERGIGMFGDTAALSVAADGRGWIVRTAQAHIKCRRLLLATNGYTDGLWPGLAQTLVPVASMITATRPLAAEVARAILPDRHAVAEYAGVPAYYRIDETDRMVFGWRGTVSGEIGSLDTGHLRVRATRLFPALQSAQWEYDWAGYVGITAHQRPMLLRLADNAYAGLGYNGRGVTMATMMGKQLAQALNNDSTSIPIEPPAPIPFHRFRRTGVAARIISGHISDRFAASR